MKRVVQSLIILSYAFQLASASEEYCYAVKTPGSHLKLSHDQAFFQIIHKLSRDNKTLMGIPDNCYKCDRQPCAYGTTSISVVVGTNHPFNYSIEKDGKTYCSGTCHFTEHGSYSMDVFSNDKDLVCNKIKQVKDGRFPYIPLFVLLGVLAVTMFVYTIVIVIWKRYQVRKRFFNSDEFSSEQFDASEESSGNYGSSNQLSLRAVAPTASPKVRIKSLDTFRGIAIVIMIFVNYGGGKYWFLNHSKWNGLTVADLVFPWFIFAMGSSIFISSRSLLRKGKSRKSIVQKILIRSAKLLALGLFLNNGSDYTKWRMPGVLQRFAVSYLVVAILNVCLGRKDDVDDIERWHDWRDAFRDIAFYPWQHLVMILVLIAHTLITFLVHDPACPKGYLGPGGLAEHGKYYNCTGGAAGYIDRNVFGLNHIYNHPTCVHPYKCLPYDPEGLLGILPSIFLTYLGLQASRILFIHQSHSSHIKRWLFWFVVWGVLAVGLCGATLDEGVIPINKNLWSMSFIFATGALAYLLLTFCYIMVDVKSVWSGAPFHFAGMNAIMLYIGHEILGKYFPFNFKNDGNHAELITRSAVGTFVWVLFAYHCYRENTFLKL